MHIRTHAAVLTFDLRARAGSWTLIIQELLCLIFRDSKCLTAVADLKQKITVSLEAVCAKHALLASGFKFLVWDSLHTQWDFCKS